MEAPDQVNSTADGDTTGSFVDQLVSHGHSFMASPHLVGNANGETDDPITILYVILIAIQIAQAIKKRREKRPENQRRLREFYHDSERRFMNRVIRFRN